MPIKLKRVLHDISATHAVEWYIDVFNKESDSDIFNFHHESLGSSIYNFEQRVHMLDDLNEHVYYVINDGCVVGYASAYQPRWAGYEHGREFGIYINSKYRNHGYGTKSITSLEQIYDAPYILSPLITNTLAISLYERLGYTNTNTISSNAPEMLLMFKVHLEV
jgi:RimJ/RimL family protein N-acetyltransferase